MSDYFFFYGTLIPQFSPPHLRPLLARFRLVGEGWARGTLYDLGTYPGAVLHGGGENRVFGRVFRATVDLPEVAELDRYEGYVSESSESSEYLRKRCEVQMESGEVKESWVYEYNQNTVGLPVIDSGRWGGGKHSRGRE